MGSEMRHCLHLLHVLCRSFIDVKATVVAFAQKYDILIARQISWVTVLAHVGGQHGVRFFLGIVIHHIAGHGRGVMFAPLVLAALAVVIEERLAVLVERHATHGHSHHLLRATTFGAHLI